MAVTLFPDINSLIWTVINLLILAAFIRLIWRFMFWRNGPGRYGARSTAVAHLCPKCQTAMAGALPHDPVKGTITVFKEPVKALWPGAKSTLTVFVCPACGFAEWYADQPEQFRSHDA